MMTRYWAIRVVVQVWPLVASVQIAASSNAGTRWVSLVLRGPEIAWLPPPGVKRSDGPRSPPGGGRRTAFDGR